jgi:hypothetical protein
MKQQLSTASNYSEACDMLRSGYVKHVRLNWNIGSDEFFRIASDWCDTGAKIKKDEDGFIISERVSYPAPALMKFFIDVIGLTHSNDIMKAIL